MQILIRSEEAVKKDQEYIDSDGNKWITSTKVAEIWNERTNNKGNYTRWSVYQRRKKLQRIETPLGDLYLESEAWQTNLRPHPARPDVAEANRKRKNIKPIEDN